MSDDENPTTTVPNGPDLNADGDGSASISNPPMVRRHEDTTLTVVAPPAQILAPLAADPTITAIAVSEMAVSNTPDLPEFAPIIPPHDLPALGPTLPPLLHPKSLQCSSGPYLSACW